jgi:hypothetical protein
MGTTFWLMDASFWPSGIPSPAWPIGRCAGVDRPSAEIGGMESAGIVEVRHQALATGHGSRYGAKSS